MSDRPWLSAYPDGVPSDVDVGAYGSLVDLLTESLIAAVEGSNLTNKDKIAAILRMSAARDLTIIELEGRK